MRILAVGRLLKSPEPFVATFDMLICHESDFPKLGEILLNRLIELGRAFGFAILGGKLLDLDQDSIELCRRRDFAVQVVPEDRTVQVVLKL